MKKVYVILAFHAHELLWDLPEKLLSYLDEGNPMKDTILDENYIKKRKEEGRDVYTLGVQLAEKLNAPICVEYSNELLHQLSDVEPEVFQTLKQAYQQGVKYPLYGHAHHTHVSLLNPEEIAREINWNMEYLHYRMGAPFPRYKGAFSPEASYSADKIAGLEKANVDYVIFPHLDPQKTSYQVHGKGDITYRPFWIQGERKSILALPRNFPVSQEIWRPITCMKRDEVKNQGYKLGEYAVFTNEYLTGNTEPFPINMDEGVEMYKEVLRRELEQAPPDGVLVYIQDLELMDFGDIAIEILARSWKELLEEDRGKYQVEFVTPDEYLDEVVNNQETSSLPRVEFQQICWAPEIRPVLRTDGHYPPLGVEDTGQYGARKTGVYDHPLVFWENGKYYCGIFDYFLNSFNIDHRVPVTAIRLDATGYDLSLEEPDTRAVVYARLMKRACNWGWRPTEGRQKLPCLKGYLICRTLLEKMERYPPDFMFYEKPGALDNRHLVGLAEVLKIFIDQRVDYLKYGLEKYMAKEGADLSRAYWEIEQVHQWKEKAVEKAAEMFRVNRDESIPFSYRIKQMLLLMQEYSLAVFMATDYLQKVWGVAPDPEFLVDRMYEYLYRVYPPLFPQMIDRIDAMNEKEIEDYFQEFQREEVNTYTSARER